MSRFRLLLQSLFYHVRGNFAVLLGVALGSAVLTGALVVGDSLRGSLRARTIEQLGWVDEALVTNRFFRARLASELGSRAAPAIMLQARVRAGDDVKNGQAANDVVVLGVNDQFWPRDATPVGVDFWTGDKADATAEAVINAALADELHVARGDKLVVFVQKADQIPRESLLGKRRPEDTVQYLELTVREVIADQGLGRFSLQPSAHAPLNAFVPLGYLQSKLELNSRVNVILAAAANASDDASLTARLDNALTLDDWNLKTRTPRQRAEDLVHYLDPFARDGELRRLKWKDRLPEALQAQATPKGILTVDKIAAFFKKERNYFTLESGQMFLESSAVRAAYEAAGVAPAESGDNTTKFELAGSTWQITPTLIYLADTISAAGTGVGGEIPYAIVAGQGPTPSIQDPPAADEIDLARWPGDPLASAKPSDKVTLTYYIPDEHNQLEKRTHTFKVRRRFDLVGAYDDPDLTPTFPGITDKLDMGSWVNPPFPYDSRRVKKADEDYWKRYKTTPRAYINLVQAQKLWGSRRFGDVTSLRFTPVNGSDDPAKVEMTKVDMAKAVDRFRELLRDKLDPDAGGFVFRNVREQGLRAGVGSTDFNGLFIGFSFFLIAAALLLVGLLFRLNLDRRGQEMGVLLAMGWSHKQVRRLLLAEGGMVAVVGSLIGLAGAVFYGDRLLEYMRANWPGGNGLEFLKLHVLPATLAIGFVASLAVSFITIYWATRILGGLAPRTLLAGGTTDSAQGPAASNAGSVNLSVVVIGLVVAAGFLITAPFLHDSMLRAISFFMGGIFLLVGFLAIAYRRLKQSGGHSQPQPSLGMLGVRNAGRHVTRSLLTVGLLASANFLIVSVESFHKQADGHFLQKDGGSGGFRLFGETTVPIFQDLNDPKVRSQLRFPGEEPPPDATVFPVRVHEGDDASCLNLYKPNQPRILGVTQALIRRGGFAFGATLAETDEEIANPWLLLDRAPSKDNGALPVFVDANTAMWILKISLGGIFEVDDGQGNKAKLQVVGMLKESIFQSELVMAEHYFLELFPRQQGYSFFLFDVAENDTGAFTTAWEAALNEQGLDVQSTASRLEDYLAVENMYLATFQALGGLGLLLGAAGLGIVLLRGVWERRGELALLRALGFRSSALGWMVLAENAFLLLLGLATGTVAALLAVAPHLAGQHAGDLLLRLAMLLGMVVVVGLLSGSVAVLTTLRAPLITALRRE